MIILVGPSASGKTEICKALCYKYGYHKFITTTTRDIRQGEVPGVDYNFVDKNTFLKMLKEDRFIEHVCYNENYYGTEKKNISLTTVLIVEPNGLESFNNLNDSSIVSFLLSCDKKTRHERMVKRGDQIEKINSRLSLDEVEFKDIKNATYTIDSSVRSINELAEEVHRLYTKKLKSLGLKIQ